MTVAFTQEHFFNHRITPDGWGEVREEAYRHMGEIYHREIAPRHFTAAGAREYRYRARKPETRIRKASKGQGDVPLVATGRLRQEFNRGKQIGIFRSGGDSVEVVVTMSVPDYAVKSPKIAAELRATSERDARIIATKLGPIVIEKMNKPTRTRRVGGL